MRGFFSKLFCFHGYWQKYSPELGVVSKAPLNNIWVSESYWYCGKCGKMKTMPFDFIPIDWTL